MIVTTPPTVPPAMAPTGVLRDGCADVAGGRTPADDAEGLIESGEPGIADAIVLETGDEPVVERVEPAEEGVKLEVVVSPDEDEVAGVGAEDELEDKSVVMVMVFELELVISAGVYRI